MKIGFLISYFYPFEGGAENNCFYLAKELAKNNEVHIFTSDRRENTILKKEEIIDNIHIHRSKTLYRYKYYLTFNPSLLTKILKTNLDILHVHSFGFIWHDLVVLIKKLTSKTIIFNTPHGPFMALSSYTKKELIFKTILENIEKITNKSYNKIIQVNPYQYKWLTKKGIKKSNILYLPNGIPKETIIQANKKEFIKKYNLKERFIISYLGRIQKYKGIDQVLGVLPNIIKIQPNILFLIMGKDAGDLKRIKDIIKNNNLKDYTMIIENINEKEKLEGLNASEIFIFPSEWEAFGIVTLEAMAQGNAIIATKTEGSLFLVEKNNGLLYDYKNIKQLESKIKELLNNREKLKILQKNNIKKAKNFTWDKIAKKLENYYKK
ncbi:MAG TPA: glycosyltransferase family 4 protein [Candidatus Nanoarchaeia archaeon]|nr:glycosyltransferase family 4 protein [Candidatus Nanoarchaeia archaeon]